jgi:hypothetical protein
VTKYVPPALHAEVDAELERVLTRGYEAAKELLERNRAALDV